MPIYLLQLAGPRLPVEQANHSRARLGGSEHILEQQFAIRASRLIRSHRLKRKLLELRHWKSRCGVPEAAQEEPCATSGCAAERQRRVDGEGGRSRRERNRAAEQHRGSDLQQQRQASALPAQRHRQRV